MFTNYWDKCPTEILCQILTKLEATTLLICMQVSSKWKDVAYYIVKNQHGGLQNVLSKRLEDGGVMYRRKSNINSNYSYLNSLLWYNITNAQIHFAGHISEIKIRHISIYKDNVVVVNNNGVVYYDVVNFNIRRYFYNIDCNRFEESDYMVVSQKPIADANTLYLSIYIKRSNDDCSFTNDPAFNVIVSHYKFHEDRCYIMKENGQMSVIICGRNNLNDMCYFEKYLGRYYGSMSNVAAMHVSCDHDLYIILKNRYVLRCDTNRIASLTQCLHIDLSYTTIPTFVATFYRFGAVFNTTTEIKNPSEVVDIILLPCKPFRKKPEDTDTFIYISMHNSIDLISTNAPNSKFDVKYYDEIGFMMIECPGLTCVTDHGNVLFLGCDNGEVKIFIKSELIKGNLFPQRTIKIEEYCSRDLPCEIRLIEVYEEISSHMLFVVTNSVTVKLSIHNLELMNCMKDVEDIDQRCLSIIHLLKIYDESYQR